MMELLTNPEAWIAFFTLTFLEIVLGIDNIIFVSIVSNKLPEEQQARARNIGLSLALILRVALLVGITWIIGFSKPLFTVFDWSVSGRDLILFAGGLFLLGKSTSEIGHKMEGDEHHDESKIKVTLSRIILQVIIMDVIFSFDSILTAVGLTQHLPIMIAAVIVAVIIMMVSSGPISRFIKKNPTLEVLALSFLILIGFMLIIEAFHYHVPKGYIYFAVFFSLAVEVVNMRVRKRSKNK